MIVTKTGKCVIDGCGVKVQQKREFHAAPKLVDIPTTVRPGLPAELVDRIRQWRDQPILCDEHSMYEVRKVTA